MCYQTQKYTMYQGDVFVYETSQARLAPESLRHCRCVALCAAGAPQVA